MNIFIKKNAQKGFTLIEVMIATALFTIIMVIGIGAVLGANDSHKRTQTVRATLDNLSFVMEEMSRSLRMGTVYHCDILQTPLDQPLDCANDQKKSIAFESVDGDPASPTDQWIYSIQPAQGGSAHTEIVKKYEDPSTGQPVSFALTPASVEIDNLKSGFTVTGACPANPTATIPCTDLEQPKVTIRLSGQVRYKGQGVPFSLQTTVSQRVIDY